MSWFCFAKFSLSFHLKTFKIICIHPRSKSKSTNSGPFIIIILSDEGIVLQGSPCRFHYLFFVLYLSFTRRLLLTTLMHRCSLVSECFYHWNILNYSKCFSKALNSYFLLLCCSNTFICYSRNFQLKTS